MKHINQIIHHHRYLNDDTDERFHNSDLIFNEYTPTPHRGDLMNIRRATDGEELTLTISSISTKYEMNGSQCHIYSTIVLKDLCFDECPF